MITPTVKIPGVIAGRKLLKERRVLLACVRFAGVTQRAEQHRCYIVATCDKELKRRIRKIPGVPIMYISNRKYSIERMAEAFGAPPT